MIQGTLSSSEIFEGVVKLASNNLKVKDDLERLIIIGVDKGRLDTLDELAFQAKYIVGLLKIIQTKSVDHDPEYFKKLNEEFQSGYVRIREQLSELLDGNSTFIKEIFETKYLQLTQESLSNLNNLCRDLSYLKLFINDLKTKKDSK